MRRIFHRIESEGSHGIHVGCIRRISEALASLEYASVAIVISRIH